MDSIVQVGGIELDLRDMAIIEQLPHFLLQDTSILTVGCGNCRLERGIIELNAGWQVLATDKTLDEKTVMEYTANYNDLTFKEFDLLGDEFQNEQFEVVICSQVLEHLTLWRKAFNKLLELTRNKLIVTVPYAKSYSSPDHRTFWYEDKQAGAEQLNSFSKIAVPYSTMITTILTKPKDVQLQQRCVLVTVDKKNKGAIYHG